MPVYVDQAVLRLDYVGGGGRSSKLRLSPAALGLLPNMQFVPGLGLERA